METFFSHRATKIQWPQKPFGSEERPKLASILIVERNPIFSRIATLILQKHYDNEAVVIGIAGQAETALLQAQLLNPNILLLDLCLPGLPCSALIPRLRTASPKTVIVALGVLDTHGSRQAALAAGADEFIPKAILNTNLRPVIQRFVPLFS